jgi:hypothetical protein
MTKDFKEFSNEIIEYMNRERFRTLADIKLFKDISIECLDYDKDKAKKIINDTFKIYEDSAHGREKFERNH